MSGGRRPAFRHCHIRIFCAPAQGRPAGVDCGPWRSLVPAEAPTRGVSVYIDINGHAPNDGFVDLEAVRLASVSLDEIGTIGREFFGFHYNFVA